MYILSSNCLIREYQVGRNVLLQMDIEQNEYHLKTMLIACGYGIVCDCMTINTQQIKNLQVVYYLIERCGDEHWPRNIERPPNKRIHVVPGGDKKYSLYAYVQMYAIIWNIIIITHILSHPCIFETRIYHPSIYWN